MEAIICHGDSRLEFVELPHPKIGNHDVLIKVRAAGICGTDYAILAGNGPPWTRYPIVPGHELAGEAVRWGAGVEGLTEGMPVVVDNYLSCNSCRYCKSGAYFLCTSHTEVGMTINGGFAEFCAVPATNVVKAPPGLTYEEASLAEPLATAIRACKRADITLDSRVVVLGCGPLGLLIVQVARSMGAAMIVLVGRGNRLRHGGALGADVLIDSTKEDWAQRVLDLTNNQGAEVILEATGSNEVLRDISHAIGRQGRIVLLGVTWGKESTVLTDPLVLGEVAIHGCVSGMGAFDEALAYLASGRIRTELFTRNRFRLDQYEEAFMTDKMRKEGSVKVIFTP